MKVIDKEMLHIHKNGTYDDIWQIGNVFIVDDSFNTDFMKYTDVASGVKCSDGKIVPFDKIINDTILELDTDEKIFKLKELSDEEFLKKAKYLYKVLIDSRNKIGNLSIKNREEALEEVRLEKFSNIASRYHSIWVCDEESINFWLTKLSENNTIYKVLLNGELFKSSDEFLPSDGEKKVIQKIEAEKYWNPVFKTDEEEKSREYLFQGKVKILGFYNK